VIQHGLNGHEFVLMVDWGGLSPMDSIVAGTLNAAKLLGWEKISVRSRRASSLIS
jgi:imidazolonepropionase-like amidohydrolase